MLVYNYDYSFVYDIMEYRNNHNKYVVTIYIKMKSLLLYSNINPKWPISTLKIIGYDYNHYIIVEQHNT